MSKHKLTGTRPKNKHLEFRKIRGQLLSKQGGKYVIVAEGRPSWIGWIELKEKEVRDNAIVNTARVIAAVNPDVLACVEIEDRPGLVRFNENVLTPILEKTGRKPYPFALVVDGNDQRGIDVGILSRHPITDISTHVFDLPGASAIFSRDCAEYFLEIQGIDGRLILMVNHFASKGSDPTGTLRRVHQADRVRDIVVERRSQGFKHIVVAGDLNDSPASASLANLIAASLGLTDAVNKFATQIDPSGKRLGTYKTGKEQIDYLLMSKDLASLARGAGIERRGHFAPRTFKSFDTVASERDQASDHHCLWVDLTV
jgi:endonuclease/exonuclease/phosphatase family metal-dependent hydrolase